MASIHDTYLRIQVPFFEDIYDATESLRAKKYMMRLKYDEIHPRDIVVAEASIMRWPTGDKDEQKTTRYRKKSWDQWRAEFRLEGIYYIVLTHTSGHVHAHSCRRDSTRRGAPQICGQLFAVTHHARYRTTSRLPFLE